MYLALDETVIFFLNNVRCLQQQFSEDILPLFFCFFSSFFSPFFSEHNRTQSGKKTVTGVQVVAKCIPSAKYRV